MTKEFRDIFTTTGRVLFMLVFSPTIALILFIIVVLAILLFIPTLGHSWNIKKTLVDMIFGRLSSAKWLCNILESLYSGGIGG